MFTRWGDAVDQVWVKNRVHEQPEETAEELFGAAAATQDRHPILGLDPVNCTPQLGVAGPWAERLPHFRMGFTPSSGAELQSEYIVHRGDAVAAIEAVLVVAAAVRPVIQVSEIRTIAADALWMSPQYGRDTVAIHFTWSPEPTRCGVHSPRSSVCSRRSRPVRTGASCSLPAPARSARCTSGTAISSRYWIASTRGRVPQRLAACARASARIDPGTARAS